MWCCHFLNIVSKQAGFQERRREFLGGFKIVSRSEINKETAWLYVCVGEVCLFV